MDVGLFMGLIFFQIIQQLHCCGRCGRLWHTVVGYGGCVRFISAQPHLVSHISSWLNTFGCGFRSMSVCGDRMNVFTKRIYVFTKWIYVFTKRIYVFTKRIYPIRENGYIRFSETDICGKFGYGYGYEIVHSNTYGCGYGYGLQILTSSDMDTDMTISS